MKTSGGYLFSQQTVKQPPQGFKMSGEAILAIAVKYGWAGIVPYLFWLKKQDKTKLDNTYTKEETGKLIDLKVAPVKQECATRTDTLHDKFDTLLELVKSDNEKNSLQRKENNDMLHTIGTSVAVIQNEIKHIKETQTPK